MTFLAPYWLFATSAVLIPIAIHLWNKRQGKTVKVGSLRWLEASASKRWSSVRLNDVWLLLLRCAILILLAVAMAQPVLIQQAQKPEGQKAVYVGEELLYTSALQSVKPTMDSLLQQGFTLRTYSPEFREITQDQWQLIRSRSTDSITRNSANYWGLLAALAEKHKHPQDSVLLFTSDQQRFFVGTRPDTMPANIHWIPVASEATVSWLQMAVQTTPDSLLLLVGTSTREGSTYKRHHTTTAATGTGQGDKLQLQRKGDTLQAIIGRNSSKVKVQTKPLLIVIAANEVQQEEVRYLQTALRAISSYTGIPVQVTTKPDSLADWVFWLREEEVPESLQQRVAQEGMQLWLQPGANPVTMRTSIATTAGASAEVYQLSSRAVADGAKSVWTAANSEQLLSVRPLGKGNIYEFRGGFSPVWSKLGQSPQLPELLLPLLFPQPQSSTFDLRALDEQQLLPSENVAVAAFVAPKGLYQHLLPWFVLAAFVLFLIERVIAGRRSNL